MKTKKLSLAAMQGKLSRLEMKSINGGLLSSPPDDDGKGLCLGCSSDSDCAAVNKGTCDYCQTHGKKCCSGWHTHS